MQQIESFDRAERFRDLVDRGFVGQVTANSDVGEQQVMLDHGNKGVDVGRREPEFWADLADKVHPDDRVITRVTLAEIMEQSAEHEEVGSGNAVNELRCVRGGFPQVPVNGEAVVGVALRFGPIRFPLGKQPSKQLSLIERFKYTNRTVTFKE